MQFRSPLPLIWAVSGFVASGAVGQPVTGQSPAQVMILGTYHMAGSAVDDTDIDVDNVLNETRQRELEELADRLERFNPDAIAVELVPEYADSLQRWYSEYRAGPLTSIPASELDQVGFRLADRLGLERVWPVDYRRGLPMTEVMEYAEAHDQGHLVSLARSPNQEVASRIEAIQDTGSVIDILRYLNSPAIDSTHQFYMALAPVGNDGAYPGAEMVAAWYERNLKIFANIWRLANPDKRVLVIIGAGHGTLLRRFVQDAPNLLLVSPLPYLEVER